MKYCTGPGSPRFSSCLEKACRVSPGPRACLTHLPPLVPALQPHPVLGFLLLPLQVFDDFIFIFFAMEMVLKMVALGIFGKKCYLGDTWNRLDFFIVMAG